MTRELVEVYFMSSLSSLSRIVDVNVYKFV